MSKLYRTFFGRIVDLYSDGVDIIFDVDGKLNTNLSSHGGKKHMLQSLSDRGNNPVATVFRAGLTLKKCILYLTMSSEVLVWTSKQV